MGDDPKPKSSKLWEISILLAVGGVGVALFGDYLPVSSATSKLIEAAQVAVVVGLILLLFVLVAKRLLDLTGYRDGPDLAKWVVSGSIYISESVLRGAGYLFGIALRGVTFAHDSFKAGMAAAKKRK